MRIKGNFFPNNKIFRKENSFLKIATNQFKINDQNPLNFKLEKENDQYLESGEQPAFAGMKIVLHVSLLYRGVVRLFLATERKKV